ncbi:MAG: hypothetical protein LC674_05625, partial [Actinobacteria bacterium]|nr:hypothetical protein [Actinomycetota bacterium]
RRQHHKSRQKNKKLSVCFTERAFVGKEVTRKAIVISKPEPLFTDEARQTGLNGTGCSACGVVLFW